MYAQRQFDQLTKGSVHPGPGNFTQKTHKMFSFYNMPGEVKSATMAPGATSNDHFKPVFGENSGREKYHFCDATIFEKPRFKMSSVHTKTKSRLLFLIFFFFGGGGWGGSNSSGEMRTQFIARVEQRTQRSVHVLTSCNQHSSKA